MKIVNVNATKNYNILIENSLIDSCGNYIREISKAKNAVIITDDIVDTLYSARVEKSLCDNGFDVLKYVISHGEDSKSAENFIAILTKSVCNSL